MMKATLDKGVSKGRRDKQGADHIHEAGPSTPAGLQRLMRQRVNFISTCLAATVSGHS